MLRHTFVLQACLAFVLAAFAAASGWAQSTCPLCGRPLGADAVTVTDWETNREYRYDDLSCAVQAMQARFPWSQATASSPQFGQCITISRINNTWRAQPEDAVVVALGGACGNLVAFVSKDELEAYRKAHPEAITEGVKPMRLSELPGVVAAEKASPQGTTGTGTPQPSVSNERSGAGASQSPEGTAATGTPQPSASHEKAGAGASQSPVGRPSLLGYSGLLAVPDARVLPKDTGAAVAGLADRKFLGAAAFGIGDGAEVAMTSRGIKEAMSGGMGSQTTYDTALYASAKQRLDSFSRPGLDVAAGITGLGKRSSLYVVGTKATQLGRHPVELTAGIGTGGVLDGLFAGLRAPLGRRLFPFAQSTDLLVESVNAGAGRSLNLGLDLGLPRGLDVKLGEMDGRPALGVGMGRSF